MSEGTFNTGGWRAVKGEVVVDENAPTAGTEEVAVEEEEVVEEEQVAKSGRVKTKPSSSEVSFTVVRQFTWHGNKFTVGEHTLQEEDYDAMMYDLNLRTDRQVFILPE